MQVSVVLLRRLRKVSENLVGCGWTIEYLKVYEGSRTSWKLYLLFTRSLYRRLYFTSSPSLFCIIVLVCGNASYCCSTSRLNGICFVVVLLKTTCSWIPLHGWFSLLQKLGHKVTAVNCYTNAKSIKLSHCCQIHYSLTTLDYPGNPQPSFLGVVNLGLKTFILLVLGSRGIWYNFPWNAMRGIFASLKYPKECGESNDFAEKMTLCLNDRLLFWYLCGVYL